MVLETTRNLAKNGNSYTVAIPRSYIFALEIMKGEPLKVQYHPDTDEIIIKRVRPREAGVYSVRHSNSVKMVSR